MPRNQNVTYLDVQTHDNLGFRIIKTHSCLEGSHFPGKYPGLYYRDLKHLPWIEKSPPESDKKNIILMRRRRESI